MLKIKNKDKQTRQPAGEKKQHHCEWSAYFDEPREGSSVFVDLHHEFTELHVDVLFTRAHQSHSSPFLKVLEELKIAPPHCRRRLPTDHTNTIQLGRKPEITRTTLSYGPLDTHAVQNTIHNPIHAKLRQLKKTLDKSTKWCFQSNCTYKAKMVGNTEWSRRGHGKNRIQYIQ